MRAADGPMHTLRDPLFTYEICLPEDVRRPRFMLQRLDPRWLVELARTLSRDEENLRIITAMVQAATGRAASGPVLHERFAELVACGRLVLRELAPPDVYPLPDPYAAPSPLRGLAEGLPDEDSEARAWISLELVHAAGLPCERVELTVTTPSGRELHGRLDAHGRWHSEDVERGACAVRLLDHPVLQRMQRARARHVPPQHGDVVWRVGSERRLDLRATEHHRIVIVQAPEPYCPSA